MGDCHGKGRNQMLLVTSAQDTALRQRGEERVWKQAVTVHPCSAPLSPISTGCLPISAREERG